MNQAIAIAAVFEFTGAMALGQTNVNTITGGIADRNSFNAGQGPYLFCFGLMIALWAGGAFQTFASWAQVNVSATHSIVGGILGFSLVHAGKSGVFWASYNPSSVPPYGGVVPIIGSWFFSPIIAGIISFSIFVTIRTTILRHENAVKRIYFVLPLLVFITIFINVFFILAKGARAQLDKQNWPLSQSAWVAVVCAAFCSIVSFFVIPFIMMRVEERIFRLQKEMEDRAKLRADLEFATQSGIISTPETSNYTPDEFDVSYLVEDGVINLTEVT